MENIGKTLPTKIGNVNSELYPKVTQLEMYSNSLFMLLHIMFIQLKKIYEIHKKSLKPKLLPFHAI